MMEHAQLIVLVQITLTVKAVIVLTINVQRLLAMMKKKTKASQIQIAEAIFAQNVVMMKNAIRIQIAQLTFALLVYVGI